MAKKPKIDSKLKLITQIRKHGMRTTLETMIDEVTMEILLESEPYLVALRDNLKHTLEQYEERYLVEELKERVIEELVEIDDSCALYDLIDRIDVFDDAAYLIKDAVIQLVDEGKLAVTKDWKVSIND